MIKQVLTRLISLPKLPLAILILLAATFWLDKAVQPPAMVEDGFARRDPDFMLEGLSAIRMGHDGMELYKLSAKKLLHYSSENVDPISPMIEPNPTPTPVAVEKAVPLTPNSSENVDPISPMIEPNPTPTPVAVEKAVPLTPNSSENVDPISPMIEPNPTPTPVVVEKAVPLTPKAQTPDKLPVRLKADLVELYGSNDEIYLSGNVSLLRDINKDSNKKLKIVTSSLSVFPDKNVARTDKAVFITEGSTTINAVGMEVDNDSNVTRLLSQVRVVHEKKR